MEKEILSTISKKLVSAKHTLAVAESVTSGKLQTLLSQAPNATCFFEGGITAYNLTQKHKQLNVNKIEAAKTNCVCQSVAVEMALGVAEMFKSDYGMGITGYASPVPEKNIYDLHAFFAICYQGNVFKQGMIKTDKPTASEAQDFYAAQLLALFSVSL